MIIKIYYRKGDCIMNKDMKKMGIKLLLVTLNEIQKELGLVDETVHAIRWHLRHTFKMNFARDEREAIDSIVWWNKKFIEHYTNTDHNKYNKDEMVRCYKIIQKRVVELKAYDDKHNQYDEQRYEKYYRDLDEMKRLMNGIGINI